MAKCMGYQVPEEVGYMIVPANDYFPETWVPYLEDNYSLEDCDAWNARQRKP